MYIYVCVALLLFLPSCIKSTKNQKAAHASKRAAFSLNSLSTNIDIAQCTPEIEAQLLDIPIMIGTRVIHTPSSEMIESGQVSLAWECNHELLQISDFYLQEMEKNGWYKIFEVKSNENTFIFEKPKKLCVLSIRLHQINDTSLIYLAISQKKENVSVH